MPLIFVSTGTFFSTYRDRDGRTVFLAPGSMVPVTRDNIAEHWEAFVEAGQVDADGYHVDVEEWAEELRQTHLRDYYESVYVCSDCECFIYEGQSNGVERDGDVVCQACYDEGYGCCAYCDHSFAHDDLRATLDDDSACGSCIDYHYRWCEHCEGYYYDNGYGGHDHVCECTSPMTAFTVPHHGARLDNDDETVVTLPAGIISDEGLRCIRSLIWNYLDEYDDDGKYVYDVDERGKLYQVANLVHQVGNEWQNRKGNFAKRLSRAAYQQAEYKVSSDLLGKIGSMAREHAAVVTELTIAVTRELNGSAEDFGNEDSCWWEGYAASRCALKSNGGFGLRSFGEHRWCNTEGRVWVMPLKQVAGRLVPTFDTNSPAAYVVFNGYGNLGGYTGARVMAQMAGMTYRKLDFSCSPMYVNGDSGYLVASEDVLQAHPGGLHLNTDEHSSLYRRELDAAVTALAQTPEVAHVS